MFKILVKLPTRQRPLKVFNVLKSYIELSSSPKNIHYLITVDDDDISMSPSMKKTIQQLAPDNISFINGKSVNKIHACNRGLNEYQEKWDIVVLASDDMICEKKEWDKIIRQEMKNHFKNTDGCLWFWDGDKNTHDKLCTMSILGRKYYERFGYLYHPDYISLFCDNEFTEVAQVLKKIVFFPTVLFRHVHFSNTPTLIPDSLMKKTQSYFKTDEKKYFQRKALNFGL